MEAKENKIRTYANIASSQSMGNFLKGDCNIVKTHRITPCFLLYFVAKIKFLSVRKHNSYLTEHSYMRCKVKGLKIRNRHVYVPKILCSLSACTYTVHWSRVSSGSIVSDYGLNDRTIKVQSPAGAKDFSSSLCVQTGSGAHPASCTMGTVDPFPGGKARPGRDADHSPPSSAEVLNE
jgi:hypothetical protein